MRKTEGQADPLNRRIQNIEITLFRQRLLIVAFVTKNCETASGLQTIGQYSDQLLCTWVHKYVGTQCISHKTKCNIMLRVGKSHLTTRARMPERTRAKAKGGIGQLRLIQHAPQTESGLSQ